MLTHSNQITPKVYSFSKFYDILRFPCNIDAGLRGGLKSTRFVQLSNHKLFSPISSSPPIAYCNGLSTFSIENFTSQSTDITFLFVTGLS